MALSVASPPPEHIRVSFEFFPPKTQKMEHILWDSIKQLEPLNPAFVSITYGAGGSTRERTHITVARILHETSLTPAAHLTCIGASRGQIDDIISRYWAEGVRHIVALRGDPPENQDIYQPRTDGYAYAVDLVKGIRKIANFEISVAAYPEIHPEAQNAQADLDNLKRKIDAGATRAITQAFFEPEVYLRFRDRCAAAGITVPITPGILPVTNYARIHKFCLSSGTSVPNWLGTLFEGLEEKPNIRKLVAATFAAEQCTVLHKNGVRDFHFYTLNRAELTHAICHLLGIRSSSPVKGHT